MYLSVVRKGMTLTSHTLIYHCLIYLHQTIFQKTVLKVSAIAYMSKSDVKRFFYYRRKFQNMNVTLALVLSDNDSCLFSLLASVNVTSEVQYVKDKALNNSLHLLLLIKL